MKRLLLFTILLRFGFSSVLNSGKIILPPNNKAKTWMFGVSAPAPVKSPLVLAVETNGRTYLTNDGFVNENMNAIYKKFLFACPAEPESIQAGINEKHSKTKNALFIEKTFEKSEPLSENLEIIENECKSTVKPSIIHAGAYEGGQEIDLYLIGYEIFFDKDIKSYEIDAFNTADLEDERFAWFNLYTIAYDRKQRAVVNVFSPMMAYKNDIKFKRSKISYLFGKEVFYEKDFNIIEIYSMENQKKVFGELFEDSTIFQSNPFEARFLGQVHLAPLHTFWTPVLKQAAQAYGNIAPMWNLIYDGSWEDVETHIEYLAKGLGAIHVITGAYGTLTISEKEIYLGPDQTVRVPAAFYKIISYSPYSPNKAKEKYNILIITSNNPFDENNQVNTRICPNNQCKEFGWDYIQVDSYVKGVTSCCELTKENLHELKMAHMEELIDKTLDLNKVPHWREDRVTLDMRAYIRDQIDDDSELQADDEQFRSEGQMRKANENDEVIFSHYIFNMYTNFIQPYFTEKVQPSSEPDPEMTKSQDITEN